MSKKIKRIEIDYNDVPLKEYPRPQFRRGSYYCLNGAWDYFITNNPKDKPKFKNKIMVPYAVESPLSGVNHLFNPDEYLVYNRLVRLPQGFVNGGRIILHFDGVDQLCDVYINNKKVGRHIGGYTKFSYDITDYISTSGYFYISLVVVDKTDTTQRSRGKQMLNRQGIFYTSTSGIYKTVWVERVPIRHIESITYTPMVDEGVVRMTVKTNVPGEVHVKIDDQEVLMYSNQETPIKLNENHPWSPESPYLYQVEVQFYDDIVKSYFGLRKIEVKEMKNGRKMIYLNNKLLFIKGLLDQGYYYLGGLTPRNYMDQYTEIKNLKSFGFNCLRKHIKTEDDLFYYFCDKLGMLVIQDFINGGDQDMIKVANIQGVFQNRKGKIDDDLVFYGRTNEAINKEWVDEALTIQNELYNHPSVVIYTIFNEGWGQFDSKINYKRFKHNDPTRLYDTNSGGHDRGLSDFYSYHSYIFKLKYKKDPMNLNRPIFLSEFGGLGLFLKDHFYGTKNFSYIGSGNYKKLKKKYESLFEDRVLDLIRKGICGFIYTQVSDVEDEVNGLYTFDREVLKIDETTLRYINQLVDDEVAKLEK